MEALKILEADMLDIVFENKNKLYGAYNLRKYYNQRLLKAMFLTGLLLAIFWLLMSFSNAQKTAVEIIASPMETVFSQIKEEKKVEEVKEKTIVNTQKPKTKELLPPVVKKDNEVSPKTKVQTLADSDNIGVETNLEGAETLIVGVAIDKIVRNVDTIGTKPKEAVAKVEKEDESLHYSVQQEASFPGGFAAWRKYLMREIDPEKPMEKGAAPGAYTVVVEFIVSKNGELSDIHVKNKIGFGLEEEAIRAIKKGPKWIPAKQNDLVVNAVRRQPITFVVPEQ